MSHLRLARLLGALFALTLTLPALGTVPASAAGNGRPPPRASASSGPGTRSLPPGTRACRSTAAKPSSPFATCTTTASAAAPARTAPAAGPLTITLTADNPALAPGESTRLLATASALPAASSILIYNLTTRATEAQCVSGTSCATAVSQSASTFRDYIAYVAQPVGGQPTNIQATSAGVVVTWMSLSLTASPAVNVPGGATLLTATASLDVGPTPYFIEIFEAVSRALVAECGVGTSCGTSVTKSPGWGWYEAYVGSFTSGTPPPPNVHAVAPETPVVTWMSFSQIGGSSSLRAGETGVVSATSTFDVSFTPFRIEIFDLTSGTTVRTCSSGTTCTAHVSQPVATTHVYVGYVNGAAFDVPPGEVIRATSNTMPVTWTPVVAVPNLIGELDASVPSILQAAGLVLGGDSAQVECGSEGLVIIQSPAAGTPVDPGSAVSVIHGVAPAPGDPCP